MSANRPSVPMKLKDSSRDNLVGGVVDLGDEIPTDEVERNGLWDASTGGLMSQVGVGRKKFWGSNSGDGGNTRDRGKTVGGAIGARGGGILAPLLTFFHFRMISTMQT
ncbi:hypothetical protein Tco_0805281 [Tanacetum coccineum]